MSVTGKLLRHRLGRVRDSTRNRAQPCALRLRLGFSAAFRRQRNLRSSRTRDFKSSASGMETSVGMRENTPALPSAQNVVAVLVSSTGVQGGAVSNPPLRDGGLETAVP